MIRYIMFMVFTLTAPSCGPALARDTRPPMKPGEKRKRLPNPPGAPQPQPPERDKQAERGPTTATR